MKNYIYCKQRQHKIFIQLQIGLKMSLFFKSELFKGFFSNNILAACGIFLAGFRLYKVIHICIYLTSSAQAGCDTK